jgi:tRNA-Thr(GGU) m(6)t(6)A37 methyltransferase TsaA
MQIEPIGIIHTPYHYKDDCPIQPAYSATSIGTVELFKQYQDGLKDIESFSHIYLLYHLDRAGDIQLIRPTFLDDQPHGIYASRHPCRPNGIGLSIVKLIKRDKNILEIAGVDMLDGTPLLDIKPYIPRFDLVPDATEGWLSGKEQRPKPRGRE